MQKIISRLLFALSKPVATRTTIKRPHTRSGFACSIVRLLGILLTLLFSYSSAHALKPCLSKSDVGNKYPSYEHPGMCRTVDLKAGVFTCVKDDDQFKIECVANPTNPPPGPTNADSVSLTNLEVIQSIQDYDNRVALIVRKTTWVRAYLALNQSSGAVSPVSSVTIAQVISSPPAHVLSEVSQLSIAGFGDESRKSDVPAGTPVRN